MIGFHNNNKGSAALLLLAIAAIAVIAICYAATSGHAHDPLVKVVTVKISKVRIIPSLPPGRTETFQEAVERLKPYAAINGTYYDENYKPLGDIVINGKVVNRGGQRHAIAVTKSGEVRFICRGRRKFNWKGYQAGLAAGPRLVHRGKIALDPVADGFSKSSLTKKAFRSGIGKTSDNRLLMVTAKRQLTLAQFAKIMLDLGAVEAMNLDGRSACALFKDGRYLSNPILPMTNVLAVYKKDSR